MTRGGGEPRVRMKSQSVGDDVLMFCRYAWADQHPRGADLANAARDSAIRYAIHKGWRIRIAHTFYGERWEAQEMPASGYWPEMWPPGLAPTGVQGVRVTAEILADPT